MLDYIGIPFKDYDCFSLMRKIYKEIHHLEIFETQTKYNESNKIDKEYHDESLNWIKLDKPKRGCIVAIRFDTKLPKLVTHFGYCINEFKMIHTTEKTNSIMENISKYEKLIDGYYIHKNLV